MLEEELNKIIPEKGIINIIMNYTYQIDMYVFDENLNDMTDIWLDSLDDRFLKLKKINILVKFYIYVLFIFSNISFVTKIRYNNEIKEIIEYTNSMFNSLKNNDLNENIYNEKIKKCKELINKIKTISIN